MRKWVGFLVAMVMPCIALATLLFVLESRGEGLLAFMTFLPLSVLFGLVISLPATLIFGLPLFWFFRRYAWNQWWQYLLGGTLAGLVTGLILSLSGAVLFGVLGALAALSLWFVLFASRQSLAVVAGLMMVILLAIGLLR